MPEILHSLNPTLFEFEGTPVMRSWPVVIIVCPGRAPGLVVLVDTFSVMAVGVQVAEDTGKTLKLASFSACSGATSDKRKCHIFKVT